MNKKHVIIIILVLIALALFSGALSRAHADSGTPSAEMLANTCAGCHGDKGSSLGPASPSIASISKDYFLETMAAYQSGERPATIMTRIAKGYNEKELALLADYFSQQPFVRHPQAYDAKQAKLGKKLHKKYCEKCHEDGGRSAEDDAGILAGQWEPYLRFTLEDFSSGKRRMEKKMKKRMDKLNEAHGPQGLEALVHYYASQQ